MKKIIITGVESTGKTFLTTKLSMEFKAPKMDEYAREYIIKNGLVNTYNQFCTIRDHQLQRQELFLKKNQNESLVLFDTDGLTLHIWSKYVYNVIDEKIIQNILNQPADLYILLTPELPWVQDGMREYPDIKQREFIHQIYVATLEELGLNYAIVDGSAYEDREKSAFKIVENFIKDSDLFLPTRII